MGSIANQPSGNIQSDIAGSSGNVLFSSRLNLGALGKNLRAWLGLGIRRPSVLVGLKLLLSGDWGTFCRQLKINADPASAAADLAGQEYRQWQRTNAITSARRNQMRRTLATWPNRPKISVILPVYNVPEKYLRKCLDSVCRQIYPDWELCIVDDASPGGHIQKVLDEYARREPRIKVRYSAANGGIAAASNAALEMATGSYIALLDHDDELTEHALFRMAEVIVGDPSVDMIYSDEDKLTEAGERTDPFFKPDWSPEYFLSCMYTCHLGVYRTSQIRQIGGWRSEFNSAQDYDLVLRLLAQNPKIHHVPDVLYHWRVHPASTASGAAAKPQAHERARAAIQQFVVRRGRRALVEDGPATGFHSVRYEIVAQPRVSIIIPTACQQNGMVERCVRSICTRSTFRNLEVIVLDRGNMPAELETELVRLGARRVMYDFPFNWSTVNNHGASAATGDFLVFLNDDVEVISNDWIEHMLGYAQWPEIGAVGAKLLFPDGKLQHTGVVFPGANPAHPFYGRDGDHPGHFFSNRVHRNWLAVTGACMMTRADVFRSIGMFDARFPLNYNDVEYCLRLADHGLRVVYVPHAQLYHFESQTRNATITPQELQAIREIWRQKYTCDPFYNPNLTRVSDDFRVDPMAKSTE
jgi:GT2 family glycosyltransferase